MNELYEIEQIKKLKARYVRTLDTNDWSEFAACLSKDCTAAYSDGELVLNSKTAILEFMQKHMSGPQVLTAHHCHTPEIKLVSDCKASGTWYLQDSVMNLKHGVLITGTAIYHDEYLKEGEQWLISETGYKRVYECVQPINESQKVTKNMFAVT